MHRIAHYAPAELVIAVHPEHPMLSWSRAMQDVAIFCPASAFHTGQAGAPLRSIRRVLSEPDIELAPGRTTLLDPWSAGAKAVVGLDELEASYVPLSGFSSTFFRQTGEARALAIGSGGLVEAEGGRQIDDPIGFMRGRVRTADALVMPADLSFCMQIALVLETAFSMGCMPDEHLDHIKALLPAAMRRCPSMGVQAQADAMILRTMTICGTRLWKDLGTGQPFALALLKVLARMTSDAGCAAKKRH